MRRTKIVCTIGPASSSPEVIEQLIQAGMDVARLNFSHGTREDHARVIARIREVSSRLRTPVAILQDLQGLKIRLGTFQGGRATLKSGEEFLITTRKVEGTASQASTSYDHLSRDVKSGDRVLIADGIIELQVLGADETTVRCRVVVGGEVSDHKGINLPGVTISASSLTTKDQADLRFGIQQGVDYVAVSFVRGSADIQEVKALVSGTGANTPVIAKLEKPEAVQHLEDILRASDGVMVARGDLGVEMPLEEVPLVQKEVIRRARDHAIPVITATQMLESMIEHPRPTRAEASDVANAIFDGTDAVMLSAETAVGKYPVETVRIMSRIVTQADQAPRPPAAERATDRALTFPDVISEAACRAARELRARVIVAFTQSGSTARLLAKYRPEVPILAFSPSEQIRQRLCLCWGVVPKTIRPTQHTDELVEEIEVVLLEEKAVHPKDALVIVAGVPMWVRGTTNLIKLQRVGAKR
jgi:pyruvate kinase